MNTVVKKTWYVLDRTMLWLAAITIAVVGAYYFNKYVLTDRTPPIQEWISAHAINSPLEPGQVLEIEVDRIKVRDDCPVTATRNVVREDGTVTSLDHTDSKGGVSEERTLRVAYPGTVDLKPGNYILQVDLVYDCPGDFEQRTAQPDVPFRIIDPDYITPLGAKAVEDFTQKIRGLEMELMEQRSIIEEITK